jgi:spore germination protein KB
VLMLVLVGWAVGSGASVIGRTAELLFFLVIFLFVLLAMSLIPSMTLDNLLPVLEYGWKPVVRSSFILLAFPYMETVLFLFFMPLAGQYGHWRKAVVRSALFSGAVFLVLTATVISVLSQGVAANLTYSSYFVIRTVSIGDFYERFEVLVSILWFITIFYRMSLLLYVTVHGLAAVFQLAKPASLLIPLLLIGLFLAGLVWPNVAFLLEWIQVWPVYAFTFGGGIPLLIWLLGKLKALRRGVA